MEPCKHIRAVIWDLGGVLVRTHDHSGRARWENQLGLKPHELERLVFRGPMGKRAALGEAHAADVWREVADQLGVPISERDRLVHDFWDGDRLDGELAAYVRSLRPRYRTGLLSNAWSDLRHFLETEWQIAGAFDHIVISAEVGFAKPDPRIYNLSLEGLRVAAHEAVFVDDFEENLAAARELGLHTVHFRTRDQTLRELGALLEAGP
ncbi:MAG: HAD family phosphatase [Anaerolineales bacterium]|jgi:HAD superfamily hydrolase (TIGR01509 family)